jgi:hypothetical protein
MGTAELDGAFGRRAGERPVRPGDVPGRARRVPHDRRTPDEDHAAVGRPAPGDRRDSWDRQAPDDPGAGRLPLWVDDPAPRNRLPDPVRRAAVRAVLIIALTLVQGMTAYLCTLAGSWLAFPMVLSSVTSTVVATWAVLDVWVTRQVWNQRNGVVSVPSSSARQLRRERRRARREARGAGRVPERIPGAA